VTDVTGIRLAVHQAVAALNELLPPEQALEPHDRLVLVGPSAALDSMGFVNFVVALEESLETGLGRALNVSDVLSMRTDAAENTLTVADVIDALVNRLD
jgi:hypothetical protein